MAEQAGPSSSAPKLGEEELATLQALFEEGVGCIQSNDMAKAVEIFSNVLKSKIQHFGHLAPECASSYYRYGSALLYQAQDSADVFGAGTVRDTAEDDDKENEEIKERDEAIAAVAAAEAAEAAAAEAAAADPKGKGPADVQGEGAPRGGGSQGEGEGEEEMDGGDLQLAWENLEVARAIWARDSAANAEQLATVHQLLGEVAMENGAFEEAMEDFNHALQHQAAAGFAADDRRIADVHFKRSITAQFLSKIDDALAYVRQALEVLKSRRARLAAEGGPASAQAVSDLDAQLEGLNEKVEELEDVKRDEVATKEALKGALQHVAAAQNAAGGSSAGGGASGSGSTAFNPLGNGAAAAPPQHASARRDLGVVGRGTKRINLAPVAPVPAKAAAEAGGAPPAAKKARSLEDMMGGEGETATGFGAPAAAPKAEEAAPLPAFLQAMTKKDTA